MSATNPSITNIINVFNKLSYEPVLDGESTLKSWIDTHNTGVFTSYINGQYITSEKTSALILIKNPFNNNQLAEFISCDKATFDKAVDSCLKSAEQWSTMTSLERCRVIYNMARNVQKHLQILTSCESINSGRTSREVKDLDMTQVIKTLYYYSGSVGLETNDSLNYEPIGLVAICGYYDNSLLSLVNKLAPALAAGNTCLIVPHKLTLLSSCMFLDICAQSGLPNGVVNLVASDNDEIYKWISTDLRIACVCFDGRSNIGQELIIKQSSFDANKRTILSLEGKSSMIIYESADFDSAIETVVDGCFYSNGQHRYSLNKLLIQENVYNDVLRRLENRFSKIREGNHMDKCNDIGPLVNSNDVDNFKENLLNQTNEFAAEVKQFENSIQDKTKLFIPPTILKNVPLNSQFNLNELNGPYLIVVPFRTVKESIELINTSKYGTGVCLYSQNISLVMEVSSLLNVGTIWINSFPIERGVQTRKQSGNFNISGFKSLRSFLRSEWDKIEFKTNQTDESLDEILKSIKSFGSLDSSPTLPMSTNLTNEKTYKLYIGGKQQRPDTQSSRLIRNETNNQAYCLVADSSRKDVRNAVEIANSSFNSWSKRTNFNKAQIIYYFGENLNSRSAEFIDKLTLLTNKTMSQCELEFKLCLDVIFYYASLCDKYTGKLNDTTDYGYLMEINEPLGCIAIICGHNKTTNYPLLTFIQHLIGAIAHGNTVIIVPDEKIPLPALDLYEIFETSDMPDGVVNILSGNKHHLTKYLCEHQQVNSVWYLYDLNETCLINLDELNALRFIKYTSSFSLKRNWLIPNRAQLTNDNKLNRGYLNEIGYNSTQSKYVHIPMGVIFAN